MQTQPEVVTIWCKSSGADARQAKVFVDGPSVEIRYCPNCGRQIHVRDGHFGAHLK